MKNPFRYRGYVWDAETELYYLGSRYYDAEVERFLNPDDTETLELQTDTPVGKNLYVYCFNNPINMLDDDGEWPKWLKNVAKVAIGTVSIGVGVIATAVVGGSVATVLAASVGMAAIGAVTGAIIGATVGVISHRVRTGSFEGAGKVAINGAIDGTATGFMVGGVVAGAVFTRAAVKGIQIKQIGRLNPANKGGNGYYGVQYTTKKLSAKTDKVRFSIEFHTPHDNGHNIYHWQKNKWVYEKERWGIVNPKKPKEPIRWTLLFKPLEK